MRQEWNKFHTDTDTGTSELQPDDENATDDEHSSSQQSASSQQLFDVEPEHGAVYTYEMIDGMHKSSKRVYVHENEYLYSYRYKLSGTFTNVYAFRKHAKCFAKVTIDEFGVCRQHTLTTQMFQRDQIGQSFYVLEIFYAWCLQSLHY